MAQQKEEPWVKYNTLGKSGIKVSNICFGTMTFGTSPNALFQLPGQSTEEQAHALLDTFSQRGGNFLDTADVYEDGMSETIIGNWMQKRQNRQEMVVATKVRFPTGTKTMNSQGLSRKHIMYSIDQSLKRLQTDYVDLYQIHTWDESTSIEETFRTMSDLVRAGKVHTVGLSNCLGWQVQEIVHFCKDAGLMDIVSLQPEYSLLARGIEYELQTICQRQGLSIIPYSPLKGGWLTGRMVRENEAPPADSRIGWVHEDPGKRHFSGALSSWEVMATRDTTWKVLDVMNDIAAKRDMPKRPDGTYKCTPIALNWALQKDPITSVIMGAKNKDQLDENMLAGSRFQLTPEEVNALDEASESNAPYPYDVAKTLMRLTKMMAKA